MKVVKPERPGGFLDFLPEDFLAKEEMTRKIEKVFKSFGFDPVETPVVEFAKVLTGKDETSKNIFFVESNQQSQKEGLAMRFDHTVPFARLLSANPYDKNRRTGLALPFKRMVLGPVFRADTPQKGRFRQFYQYDIDIAGTNSMLADAEIVLIIKETLSALGINDFLIRLNNRKILNGIVSSLSASKEQGISLDDLSREIMRILDKIESAGKEAVFIMLQRKPENDYDPAPNLSNKDIKLIDKFLSISGCNLKKLDLCLEIFSDSEEVREGVEELREIINYLNVSGVNENLVRVDFSVARGLDYYTGPVMETVILSAPEFGSVFSGGRYDDLIARFTNSSLPAVGASIGVDRLFYVMKELKLINESRRTSSDVLILNLSDEFSTNYLKMAGSIREIGLNVEICLLKKHTFKAQFNYALNKGVKFVVIFGEDEAAEGKVKVKNLESRKQFSLELDELVEFFKNN